LPDARVMRRLPRRLTWLLACAAGLALVAAVAVGVALLVTPMQTVTVAGQVIKVGTTSPRLSLSGPGEVDLFGQNLPTVVRFTGPVRPRLALTQITIDSELANFAQGSSPGSATHLLGARLNDGWTRYFAWEAGLAGLTALILTGAVAGWRRLPAGPTARLLLAGLVVTELINLGSIVLAAHGAQKALRQVRSLNELVGSDPAPPAVDAAGPLLPGVQAVVIGDSTAAGAGLSLVADASHIDRACGRSSDSYAEGLAGANGWRVMNLACNAATISHGLLGPEHRHGLLVPAQLGATLRAQDASVVIVSVGADDLKWSAIVKFCAAAPRCNDRASTAYFQQKLAAFSKDYFQLLTELANLHGRPRVIINLYYDPFGNDLRCIAGRGLTAAKVAILRSRLVTLNKVLSTGAAEFGYASVQPSFAGHQLCAPQPYVQGAGDLAPFHPTELGQLAIALADQVALTGASGTTSGGATGTPGTPGATGSPAP
jgi:GDSL-like Lipase/Acylhydrolase family